MTVQGIPLLYPFRRNACVIPGNPELRFKSGDFHSEAIIFCVFIILGFTCKDLFKHGFWTSYNKAFGSVMHLAREFKKSTKVIKVDFHFSNNGKECLGEGFLMGIDGKDVFIYSNLEIIKIPNTTIVYQLDYERTDKKFEVIDRYFYSITIEEFYRFISAKPIIRLRITSESDVLFSHKGAISKNCLRLNYVTNPDISVSNPKNEGKKRDLEVIDEEIVGLSNKERDLRGLILQIKGGLKQKNLYEREIETLILKKLIMEVEKIDKVVIPKLKQKKICIEKGLGKQVRFNGYVSYVDL